METTTKKNPYAKYHTDENLLKAGIWYEDDDLEGEFGTKIRVTYAGTENSRYEKMLKLKLKPFETQIRNDNFSDAAFHKVLGEVYAATVIQEWLVKKIENGETTWVPGVYNAEGEIVEATEKNYIMGLALGQRLFTDLIKVATNFNLFRQGQKEEDAKN